MSVDLSFDQANQRFNIRASAIIRHNGFVLCDYEERLGISYLPGGRFKRGENSQQALVREMGEELGATVQPGRPKIVTESFYTLEHMQFHELTFYFYLQRPEALSFVPNGVCRHFEEDGNAHELRWIEASPTALAKADVKPLQLHDYIISPPENMLHLHITH